MLRAAPQTLDIPKTLSQGSEPPLRADPRLFPWLGGVGCPGHIPGDCTSRALSSAAPALKSSPSTNQETPHPSPAQGPASSCWQRQVEEGREAKRRQSCRVRAPGEGGARFPGDHKAPLLECCWNKTKDPPSTSSSRVCSATMSLTHKHLCADIVKAAGLFLSSQTSDFLNSFHFWAY